MSKSQSIFAVLYRCSTGGSLGIQNTNVFLWATVTPSSSRRISSGRSPLLRPPTSRTSSPFSLRRSYTTDSQPNPAPSSKPSSRPPNAPLIATLAPVSAAIERSTTALQANAQAAYAHVSSSVLPKIAEHLNTLTGYSVVQECKTRVVEKDRQLNLARDRSDASKRAYETTIEERRKCQRELNSLLQRKDTWLDSDITRFTELYRKDLSFEQAENSAKLEHKHAAEDFDKSHREYLNEIRERYIEEQLYSDKIRRASTWWTWGLISLHFLLFLSVQLFVEPRKRRILKEELGQLIINTSRQPPSLPSSSPSVSQSAVAWDISDPATQRFAEQLVAPLAVRIDALQAQQQQQQRGDMMSAFAPDGEREAFTARPPPSPQSATGLYPKDRLFYKGVVCGAILGVASSLLVSFGS
ncbi:sensitivity to high expression protein she9 [Thoreauomyces humboldtii]|nr:sensitivity to high expression protein she9 [Thoreauomyces humboldtii]